MQYPYLIILLLSVGGNLHLVGRGQVHLAYDAAGASIALKTKALSQGYNSHPWGMLVSLYYRSFLLVFSSRQAIDHE